jgi:hypothetical protein
MSRELTEGVPPGTCVGRGLLRGSGVPTEGVNSGALVGGGSAHEVREETPERAQQVSLAGPGGQKRGGHGKSGERSTHRRSFLRGTGIEPSGTARAASVLIVLQGSRAVRKVAVAC